MGWLSKAWKGIKGAVKGIAKGIKKVAKGIVTSIPGGQKLWKAGGKLGKKVMAGLGKLTAKLGPIGTMALSFVLAPIIGPAISGLWGGFGAGAAAMAGSANALVSTLGSVGSGIFAAGNFVGGTLGALGNAVTEGASQVMAGNFSGALTSFSTNVSSALTGKAGMASVNAAAAQAAQAAGTLAGQGVTASEAVLGGMDPSFAAENLGKDALGFDVSKAGEFSIESLSNVSPSQISGVSDVGLNGVGIPDILSPEQMMQQATTGKVGALTFAENDALSRFGTEGVKALQPGATNAAASSFSNVKEAYKVGKSLLGGGQGSGGYSASLEPLQDTLESVDLSAPANGGGVGSAGFSLLSGVRGLENSVRNSQNLMFS